MSLDVTALPYGIRDIKLTSYTDAAGTQLGTTIDLPNGRTLGFTESEDFNVLRGDDRDVAAHGNGPSVKWTLESGGLPFEAFQMMSGGEITETGSSPDQTKVYAKKATQSRPYFRVEGQAISDSGGDVHVILHRCKAMGDLSGEFKDGEFFLTAADGQAFAMPSGPNVDEIYRFVQNESVTAIPGTGIAPSISSATPTGSSIGDKITLVGEGFTGASAVTIDGQAATGLTAVNDQVLVVTIPAGVTTGSPVDVVVTTPSGDSIPFEITVTA